MASRKHLHAALEGCTAWHVAVFDDADDLDAILGWYPLSPPYPPVRVLDHTCDRCAGSAVSYEFGQVGGAYVIRRTDRSRPSSRGALVSQTPPLRLAVVEPWWQAVRMGTAR